MSALAISTHGIAGGSTLALSTHGLVPAMVGEAIALPPLPIEVTFPRPLPAPRVRTKYPNPRPITPNADGGMRLNRAPELSLVEVLASTVDDMRQMLTDFGLRYYQVFSVVVRWSGGGRHRGTASVVSETPFLPVPKVEGIERVDRSLRSGGAVKRGDIRLAQISPRYTEDDIALMLPRELRDDEEHFIEIRGDARDGSTVRARYVMTGTPERGPWGWSVRMTKADENRTREGQPR